MALDGLTLVVVVLELKNRRMEEVLVDDIVLEGAMVSGLSWWSALRLPLPALLEFTLISPPSRDRGWSSPSAGLTG